MKTGSFIEINTIKLTVNQNKNNLKRYFISFKVNIAYLCKKLLYFISANKCFFAERHF